MDVLVVTLWILCILISHLLLRRVVEIDNMNKQLLSEKSSIKVEKELVVELSDEELKKELLDYVESQEYEMPKPEFELPSTQFMMPNMPNNLKPLEVNTTNVVQEFKEERDLNSGIFGDLQAYEDNGFASI